MSVEAQTTQPQAEEQVKPKKGTSTFNRVFRYTSVRVLMLLFTVATGVFLTIMIANMGGYVDQIMRGNIRDTIAQQLQADENFQELEPEQRNELMAELVALEEERMGLNRPFAVRAVNYLRNALVLDLGRAINMSSDEGSKEVRNIILERLPPTLLLMGTANFILFFGSLFIALVLSRQYGSIWDKVILAFSPTSSAPSWFYGLFLILIFAAVLRWLPFGGMVSSPPADTQWGYILDVLKHLILPASSLIVASLFVSIYNWRTFFLIYSTEDYVEMAKAKGLTDREIERRYILRPTLPNIITNFSLTILYLWQGAIITETVFSWPGLGRTYFTAIGFYDTPVIVGNTIIFAYLLAITVFLLDFIYALVDPRVKIGES
jgi:peptide/nickel transport system permease protein